MDTASAASALEVRHLGLVPYGKALELQQELRQARLDARQPDTVLLLEHPDVITFGRGARSESARLSNDELRAAGYEVFRVNRGGDVTYHGPGQRVGYPILDLERHGRDVHEYLRLLEAVLIDTVADFGIAGRRREGQAGVWLDDRRKIASIGVGVRRWVTMHGFALNVASDLLRFGAIVPCGLQGVEMVSMAGLLGRPPRPSAVRERAALHLTKAFA